MTPEAFRSLFEKEIEGFGEMFRFRHLRKLAPLLCKVALLQELRVVLICLLYPAHPLLAVMRGMIYWHISWIIDIGHVILLKLCRGSVKLA